MIKAKYREYSCDQAKLLPVSLKKQIQPATIEDNACLFAWDRKQSPDCPGLRRECGVHGPGGGHTKTPSGNRFILNSGSISALL